MDISALSRRSDVIEIIGFEYYFCGLSRSASVWIRGFLLEWFRINRHGGVSIYFGYWAYSSRVRKSSLDATRDSLQRGAVEVR